MRRRPCDKTATKNQKQCHMWITALAQDAPRRSVRKMIRDFPSWSLKTYQMEIAIDRIIVPEGHRALDPVKVAEIAASIKLLGLLSPIGIRRHGDAPVELVWGGHRLAACQSLGMKTITARAVDGLGWDQGHRENADLDDFVKMTEIAENLHRSDLTTQERNEHLAKWVALLDKLKRNVDIGDAAPISNKPGRKPSPTVVEVAKRSGLGQKTVKEAVKASSVSTAVKVAADKAKLTVKQRLAIARLPKAEHLGWRRSRSRPIAPRRRQQPKHRDCHSQRSRLPGQTRNRATTCRN